MKFKDKNISKIEFVPLHAAKVDIESLNLASHKLDNFERI